MTKSLNYGQYWGWRFGYAQRPGFCKSLTVVSAAITKRLKIIYVAIVLPATMLHNNHTRQIAFTIVLIVLMCTYTGIRAQVSDKKSFKQSAQRREVTEIPTLEPIQAKPDERVGVTAYALDGTVKHVEKMPLFKGNLGDWLGKHLVYPENARAHNQQGRSIVKFIVDEEGHIKEPFIETSSGYKILDEEALRVVRLMPDWIPAFNEGKNVPVFFTMPVSFKLN